MGDVNTSTAASRDKQEIIHRRGDAPRLGGGERITVLLDASRCRGDAAQPRTHQVGCSASRPVVSMRRWSIRLALPLIHGIRLQRDECGSADDHGTFTARTVDPNQNAERLGAGMWLWPVRRPVTVPPRLPGPRHGHLRHPTWFGSLIDRCDTTRGLISL